MKGRRGDTHRLIRWLWTSRRFEAKVARLPLLPAAALWRGGMALREMAYRRQWLPSHDLPLPTVAVGNLTVGGSGKTPVAIWIARHYVRQGLQPGILLRGYGGDETQVHRRSVPEAVVVADPDRRASQNYKTIARRVAVKIAEKAQDHTAAFPRIVTQNT